MQPEKGDPSIRVTATDVCAGLKAAGAMPGDMLIYHGSLSSMGTVVDGADTVTEGAREAVAPGGTVAMPTLWYHGAEPPLDPEDWDIDHSPAYIGALAEAFRAHPDSVRSDHFSHAVSAIGPRAQELVADHGGSGQRHTPWGPRAFAEGSPWGLLYAWNALYCFIGVTFRVLTMKHYLEARIVEEILADLSPERRALLTSELSSTGIPGIWAFFNSEQLEERLAEEGFVSYGRIGSARVRGIRTQILVNHALPMLRNTPEDWFSDEFLDWRRRAREGQQ
ncbi:MAG: AAC(3) family N-acetyltransferase [Lentisphaerae bacterium]|jgi:aminoglycoside 3-N-acetyltransferase|nr:AAC(3) family N-acetyltransferase [Lentisphaerota bacterium]MBT4821907.1 AAC(3) family N-acetyltransferase [Lentisphaerota bacterium]MBT5608541.1 AAC(3) family N-acetyltransferase [Lentisphaerota bacterium]MBT7062196.1 AAC(3) family N-acetyltransferase [Lentisphaerota bacterium]MBT7844524.1 AAC(3) family N-acetyltransferase [Lentisphaerota bacterium]